MFGFFKTTVKRKEINRQFKENLLADVNIALDRYGKRMERFSYLRVFLWALQTRGRLAVLLFRIMRRSYKKGHKIRVFIISRLSQVICGVEIGYDADIGPGFEIIHGGSIVIGNEIVAGCNLSIRQGVTIGGNLGKRDERGRPFPVLGDKVLIGSGACIVGPVTIGSNVIIGANAVVTKDLPDNSVFAGYGGAVIRKDGQNILIQERSGSLGCYLKEVDERLKAVEHEIKLIQERQSQNDKQSR